MTRKSKTRPRVSSGTPQDQGRSDPSPPAGLAGFLRFLPVILVAGAALAVYTNALQDGFTWDDIPLLVNNQALARPDPPWEWFRRDYFYGTSLSRSLVYRPLTILSHIALLRLTGLTAWSFHLANILLHAGVSVLVWAMGRRLLGGAVALAGALLFAVHPLHTEAVTSIVGRAELLAALFSLGAVLFFLRATEANARHPVGWTLGAAICFTLALFSKEHTVTLPAWFALVWLSDRQRRPWPRAAVTLAVLIVVLLAFLALRWAVVGDVRGNFAYYAQQMNPAFGVSAPRRWLTAAAVTLRYAGLFVWPRSLSFDYSYAQILASQRLGAMEVGGFLVIGTLLWAIFYAWRRVPGLALALAFVPVTFFVTSNFPIRIGTIMAERLTYLPSVGLCLLAGWALTRLDGRGGLLARVAGTSSTDDTDRPESRGMRGAAVIILASLTLALGIRTLVRNEDWRDQNTLVRAAYEVSPRSHKVLTALSQEEARRGNEERARALFEEARAMMWNGLLYDPDLALAAGHLGERLLDARQPAQAEALFKGVLRTSANDARALLGLARAALMLGKLEEAKVYARRAASLGAKLPPELSAILDQ